MIFDVKKWGSLVCGAGVFSALLGAFAVNTPHAYADIYSSSSDAGAELLDQLENDRRSTRHNQMTEEQSQLLKDAYEMRNNLRNPLDPTKNVPVSVEAGELFYNEVNGDVKAEGNVVLTTLDAKRFTTELAIGNLKDTTVDIEGKGHVVQMTPDQARVVLTGYKTQYNYGDSIGKMESVNGKVGNQYVKCSRIEFYPDMLIIYNGSATKCSAQHPDYHMTAEKMEIWPNQKTIAYNVKYYIGDTVVYATPREENDPNKEAVFELPKAGYDTDNGLWVEYEWSWDLVPRVRAYIDAAYMTKENLKANGGFQWTTAGFGTFTLSDGFYEDSNNVWIRKQNDLKWTYELPLGNDLPFTLKFGYERGKWTQKPSYKRDYYVSSIHTKYYSGFNFHPIKLGSWDFQVDVGYSVTKESSNHSSMKGFDYQATLLRIFDPKWSYYARYKYTNANSQESVFDYDLDSYSRKFMTGVGYTMDKSNRFVFATGWDMDARSLRNTEYYWFHDFHCLEMIASYKVKRDTQDKSFKVSFQFNAW